MTPSPKISRPKNLPDRKKGGAEKNANEASRKTTAHDLLSPSKLPPETNIVKPRKESSSNLEKRSKKKSNRRLAKVSESVMVVVDNPKGLRWIMEFAPLYASVLSGIETTIRDQGKRMHLCSVRSEEELDKLIKNGTPDGILVMASSRIVSWRKMIGNIPCVGVLGQPCEGVYDRVAYDSLMTGRLPAEYFIENGIRRAAILGPRETETNGVFKTRHRAFIDTMNSLGGEVIELMSANLYDPSKQNKPIAAQVEMLVDQLARSEPRPGGLFVMADNILPSVYRCLRMKGIPPSSSLRIVSCNAEKPYLIGLDPEPAKVEIPAEEIGRRAVEILAWRQSNPSRLTTLTLLPPVLLPPGVEISPSA